MTKEYWKDLIDRWQSSDLSMAEFCRQENLSYWSFRQWRKRFQSTASTSIVKLDIKKVSSSSRTCNIEIKSGSFSIMVPSGYDEPHLIRLLSTLRKITCF